MASSSEWTGLRPLGATATLSSQVRHFAQETPDAPAVLGMTGSHSWRELDTRADQLANALDRLGMKKGDRSPGSAGTVSSSPSCCWLRAGRVPS
jgi:non-ribosomal peptide synthetase component E (peptide arylation enzyme)